MTARAPCGANKSNIFQGIISVTLNKAVIRISANQRQLPSVYLDSFEVLGGKNMYRYMLLEKK